MTSLLSLFSRGSVMLFCALAAVSLPISERALAQDQAPGGKAKPTVSGTFLGDGKDGKIQHLVVLTREPFSDKPAIRLVFTEKNPAGSKKPDFDAGFKKLGSALIISVFQDGQVFGCEVAHSTHEKSPFSAVGKIKVEDMKVTDTRVSGRLTTGGEEEAFGQKWAVDLVFSAPLPKGAFAAVEAESEPASAPKKEAAAPAGPKMKVGDLPLPTGAKQVEYKAVVGHILFAVDKPVSAVANDYSALLKKQGWKDAAGSLVGKKNAILKRTLNGADLTVMVQPAGAGCTVKVFTQGLDWSSVPASAPSPAAAIPAVPGLPGGVDPSAIEAEANRLINEALKGR